MKEMKKLCTIAVMAVLFVGCSKNVTTPTPIPTQANAELNIASAVGIKLQTTFVTSEVAMNVKSDVAQTATVKIFDIANRVVSKETINVKAGDNIVKVYTSALPSSAYRIALYDANGNQLAITDFNKL
jgi:PBP1b-binding outer membrane lipoprotein LpoB